VVSSRDLTLGASAAHDMSTDAETGASGGGVSIAPAVAIALSNITTTATVAAGTAIALSGGSFTVTADQTAAAHTSAAGDTKGASASIGIALGLTIANHLTEATLLRNVSAIGAVTLAAHGSSDTSASATASAAGAPGDASAGGSAGGGVDQSVAAERSFASATDGTTGGSGTAGAPATPHAATSAGGVSVAAAIAINLATTTSRATIGAINVLAGGRFMLSTSADTDAFASADGAAVRNATDSSAPADSSGGSGAPVDSTTGVSIGAGVAIDYARIRNEAILPFGATVTADGATIEARMGSTHELGASAMSGAGGGSLSIAGSVAIDVENIETTASLAGMLHAGSGNVVIFALSSATGDVTAVPAEITHHAATTPAPPPFTVVSLTDVSPSSSPLDSTTPNGASGGRVNHVAAVAGNNQIFYAATEWGGLYKTTDGGQNWTFLGAHKPLAAWDVEVDPSNTQRVYATSFYDGRVSSLAGINVSTDGGTKWTHPATATPTVANTPAGFGCPAARVTEPSAMGIGIRPDAPSNIFVGTDCGVAISTDSGSTWRFVDPTPLTPAGDIWGVVVQGGGPTGQGIVDVCGDDGHFRSTDGGTTWVGGPVAGLTPGGPCSIVASPDESYVLFAVVGTQIFESDDGGVTWPTQFANPSRQGRIPFVVTNQRSNAAGVNRFDLWFGDTSLHRASCVTPAVPASGGAARCPAPPWAGPFTSTRGAHDDLGDLAFDTQAANDACPAILASDGGVYRNTDSTATCQTPAWEQPITTPHALWIMALAGVHIAGPAAEALYFGVQDDGSWGTTNAGAILPTWTNSECCDIPDFVADANRVVYTICCSNAGAPIRMFVRGPGLVGGGVLPAASMPPGNLLGFRPMDSIDRFADKQYVVVTSSGVYITTDITARPVVWTQLPGSPANACAVRAADTAGRPGTPTFFVQAGICNERTQGVNGDQLWRYTGTTVGGTWTRIDNTGAQTGGVSIFAVDPTNSNRLYAANMNPVTPRMVLSTDAGLSWQPDPKLDTLMTGSGAFRFTTQRGPGNFSTISPAAGGAGILGYAQPTLLAFDPRDPNIIVAGGRDSGVFLSVDKGKTWGYVTDPFTSDTSGIPHLPRPWFAYFDHLTANAFDLYVGTQGRGVWRVRINIPQPAPDEGPTGIGASVALAIVDDDAFQDRSRGQDRDHAERGDHALERHHHRDGLYRHRARHLGQLQRDGGPDGVGEHDGRGQRKGEVRGDRRIGRADDREPPHRIDARPRHHRDRCGRPARARLVGERRDREGERRGRARRRVGRRPGRERRRSAGRARARVRRDHVDRQQWKRHRDSAEHAGREDLRRRRVRRRGRRDQSREHDIACDDRQHQRHRGRALHTLHVRGHGRARHRRWERGARPR
jgi:hypothetical protein